MFAILALSALLVLGATTVYYLTGENYERKRTVGWHGSQLTVQTGQGTSRDRHLEITGLDPQHRAIVEIPIQGIDARDYASLGLSASNLTARTRLELVWLDGGEQPKTLRLPPLTSGHAVASLSDHRHWQGPVQRLFLVVGAPLPEPITILRLSLHPTQPTAAEILGQIWGDWTAFEGWRGHSINFIVGGVREALLSPVLAAALWVALSAAIYGLFAVAIRRPRALVPFAVIFMAGWLVLDLRWQVDLARQLEVTRETFAGKSWEEKGLAAVDGDLFRVARGLHGVLEERSANIGVISARADLQGEYVRGRLRYHLAPHHLLWILSDPPSAKHLSGLDYVVFALPVYGIRYDDEQQKLVWPGGDVFPIELIHADAAMALLRLVKEGS